MTQRYEEGTQSDVPVSKLVAVRLPDDLRKRIEEHRARMQEHTSLDLSLSQVIKSLVERGLEAFAEEQKATPRKR